MQLLLLVIDLALLFLLVLVLALHSTATARAPACRRSDDFVICCVFFLVRILQRLVTSQFLCY